jgi:hypothetical protein
MTHFDMLTAEEKQILYKSIPQVTVLIAGADGKIDVKEKEWAEKITKIRSFSYNEDLKEFYTVIGDQFMDHLGEIIAACPEETTARTEYLTAELSKLNPVLRKLDNEVASALYKDFLSFAKQVAKASGGFLSFMSISKEEKELIGLDMLDPIVRRH